LYRERTSRSVYRRRWRAEKARGDEHWVALVLVVALFEIRCENSNFL